MVYSETVFNLSDCFRQTPPSQASQLTLTGEKPSYHIGCQCYEVHSLLRCGCIAQTTHLKKHIQKFYYKKGSLYVDV